MDNTLYQLIMDSATSTIRLVVYAVFAVLLVPWLKNSAIPWLKEKQLYGIVLRLVRAAEKMGAAGKISKEAKLDYVVGMLAQRGITLTPEVRALIESAVYAIDEEMAKVGTVIHETTVTETVEVEASVVAEDDAAETAPVAEQQKPVETMLLEAITSGAEILAAVNAAKEAAVVPVAELDIAETTDEQDVETGAAETAE